MIVAQPITGTSGRDIVDPEGDEVAAAQLAVDGEVEHRQIALGAFHLEADTNGPHLLRLERPLLANETALVPNDARVIAPRLGFGGYD